MILRRLLLPILCFLVAFPALAGDWELLNPPAGSVLTHIVKHHGALYVGTVAGLYKSADQGNTWQRTGGKSPGGYTGLYSFNDVLFARVGRPDPALTQSVLYRSMDEGLTWQASWTPPNAYANLQLYEVQGALYIRAYAQMLKSTDNGATWTEVGSPLTIQQDYPRAADDALYMLAADGLYRSADGAATWQRVNAEIKYGGGVSFYALGKVLFYAIWGQQPFKAFLSQDGGLTWDTVAGLPEKYPCTLLDTGNVLLAECGTLGRYQSSDRGKNWSLLSPQPTTYRNLSDYVDGILFETNAYGTSRSIDLGKSFTDSLGLPGKMTLLGVAGERIVAQNDSYQTFYSSDGGKTWITAEQAGLKHNGNGRLMQCYVYALREQPAGMTVPESGSCPQSYNGSYYSFVGPTLMRSRDGGVHWDSLPAGPWVEVVKLFFSGNSLYLLARRANGQGIWLYGSRDGGESWNRVALGSQHFSIRQLTDAGAAYYAVGAPIDPDSPSTWQPPQLYASSDLETWRLIPTGTTLPDSVSTTLQYQGSLYAIGMPLGGLTMALYRSDDDGAAWIKEAFDPIAGYPAVNSIKAGTGAVYLGSAAGVYAKRIPTGAEVRGGIYTCDMATGGVADGQAYLVVSGDGTGRTVVSNPALSAVPKYFGKVSGSVSGTDFNGSTSGGTGWRGAFAGDTFRFISQGSDASSGNCRLIFDNQAPAGAPRTGAYTCTVGKDSTEIALTVNRAGQAVITNSAAAASTRYFGYVVGSLTGKDYRGTTDGGQAWSATFDGNAFTFNGSGAQGNCRAVGE